MEATRINAICVPWRASAELPEPAQNGSARVLPTVPVAQRHTVGRHHLGTDPQSIIGWREADGSLLEILVWLRQHQEDVRANPAGAGARYAAIEDVHPERADRPLARWTILGLRPTMGSPLGNRAPTRLIGRCPIPRLSSGLPFCRGRQGDGGPSGRGAAGRAYRWSCS